MKLTKIIKLKCTVAADIKPSADLELENLLNDITADIRRCSESYSSTVDLYIDCGIAVDVEVLIEPIDIDYDLRALNYTPISLGIKKRTIIEPRLGWKQNTFYQVLVAFNSNNPIYKILFYSGFLSSKEPGAYNKFGFMQESLTYDDAYYIQVLDELELI